MLDWIGLKYWVFVNGVILIKEINFFKFNLSCISVRILFIDFIIIFIKFNILFGIFKDWNNEFNNGDSYVFYFVG